MKVAIMTDDNSGMTREEAAGSFHPLPLTYPSDRNRKGKRNIRMVRNPEKSERLPHPLE